MLLGQNEPFDQNAKEYLFAAFPRKLLQDAYLPADQELDLYILFPAHALKPQ